MAKKKRNAVRVVISVIALLVIAAVYFFVLPTVTASNYIRSVKEAQPELRGEMQRVSELLERDIFVVDEPTISVIRTDVKASQDILADAQNQLKVSGDALSAYSELPLTGWMPTASDAKKLAGLENTYVKEAKAATNEMSKVIQYFDDSADYIVKLRTLNLDDKISDATTVEEIAASLKEFTKEIESIVKKLSALDAPESLKESHDYSVTASNDIVKMLKEITTALEAEDYDKVDALYGKMNKSITASSNKLDKLFDEFVNKSKLRIHIDKMLETDREIKSLLR